MKLRFSDLRIGLQVAGIAVVAATSLAVVGFVQIDGRQKRDAAIAEAVADRALHGDVTAFEITLLQLRRAEKNFLMRLDQKSLDEHAASRATGEALLARVADASRSGERSRIAGSVERIDADFKKYIEAFDRLVQTRKKLGLKPESGYTGDLKRAAQDIESVLAGIGGDSEITNVILKARRYEKDFMLQREAKYVEGFDRQLTVLADRVAALDLAPTMQTDLTRSITLYRAGFHAWAAGDARVTQAGDTMMAVHREMEPMVEEIAATATALLTAAEARAEVISSEVERGMVWTLAGAFLALLGLSFVIGRAISRPIVGMTDAMTRLADGDLDAVVPGRDAGNEIGRMARAVEVFRDNARERLVLEAAQREASTRSAADRRAAMLALADSFEGRIGGVVATVSSAATELEAAAGTLSTASEEVSAQSTAVAAAAEQATANVRNVAAATEELSSTVTEVGRQVERSAETAAEALSQAEVTTEQVRGLSAAAEQIGTIVQLIADIASQTNLLALNATIEAARAGDAGRGFAVVAQEVKGLAEQTARATGEIGRQVSSIQGSTHRAADAIDAIAQTIATMNTIAGSIAAAVEEQGVTTLEISRNLQEAAHGTGDVSANIEGVSAGAVSSSAASSQVLTSASNLAGQAEMLRSAVTTFLDEVRAA